MITTIMITTIGYFQESATIIRTITGITTIMITTIMITTIMITTIIMMIITITAIITITVSTWWFGRTSSRTSSATAALEMVASSSAAKWGWVNGNVPPAIVHSAGALIFTCSFVSSEVTA
jgi:hypothetical protein